MTEKLVKSFFKDKIQAHIIRRKDSMHRVTYCTKISWIVMTWYLCTEYSPKFEPFSPLFDFIWCTKFDGVVQPLKLFIKGFPSISSLIFSQISIQKKISPFWLQGEELYDSAVELRQIPTHPVTLCGVFFFRIFSRTMQVLGKPFVKATMTIHCSNLHHWRLGSYHFLFPIRQGRTAGAQFQFLHTYTYLHCILACARE